MKKSTKELWKDIETRITAGDAPKVFVNRAGQLCLAGLANNPTLPAKIAAMIPEELVLEAREKAARDAEVREAQKLREAAEYKQHRKALLESVDLDQCRLFAGEDTSIVAAGKYDDVLSMLSCVCSCARDPYVGKGCWKLVAQHKVTGEPVTLNEGCFDQHCYW